ncbi:MAG TPA: ABC transporter substrate-binding protein [Burkholderiaceae bacterium]|nr:ABC transporter substrate-binding protein [Burkholderiaceae bacterium]
MTHPTRRHAITHLAAATASIALPALGQTDRRVVLGQSAAFSGAAAQLGIQMNRGARLYFDAANANGGINGIQVELRTLDDQYEPDKCKANTEQLIKDDVFALFGYVGTPTSLAALPLVNQAKIPFFGPFTGAEALREPLSRYVFHLRASYYDETALIVKQLTALGLKKIAVFRQNDSYGQAGYDGVVRALKAQNLAPVAVGLVERNTVDVAAAVSTIVPTQPDAVVQISAYKSCAAFIREARKAGYGGTFYNVSFVGTQALADELGRSAMGVVVSQVVPFPFSMTTPISREYLAAVQRAGGDNKPNYSSMEGYLAAKLFAEGMRRAGRTLNRDALIAGLESVQSLDLGGFVVGYAPHSHVASRFVDLSMLTEDGRVRV